MRTDVCPTRGVSKLAARVHCALVATEVPVDSKGILEAAHSIVMI